MTTSAQRETNMTPGISGSILSWLSFVGATMPPRDPNDDEDEEDEEDGGDADDDREPAVIREPDEDWSSIGAHFNNGRCAKRRAASPHGGNAPIRCVCENTNRP